MFEERRNQINGRPPVYTKTVDHGNSSRRTTRDRGWDRSHPLDPLPVSSHDRNPPPKIPVAAGSQSRSRARGVSLERGARGFGDGDMMRRSKSQYQMDDGTSGTYRAPKLPPPVDGSGSHLLNVSTTLKPRSMTSLLDDNQNNVIGSKTTTPKFGYNQSPVRNYSQRYQGSSPYR